MKTILIFITIALTNFALPIWAADPPASEEMQMHNMQMNPSTEDRKKMATAHAKMATCLGSAEEFSQCHNQLRTDCESINGAACAGMGKAMHKGKKHKR